MPAYRLVGVREASERARRVDAPMVGRARELELLQEQLADATASRAESARHRRRRGGRRQVAPDRRVDRVAAERRYDPARALPPLRRGHHVLAARRGRPRSGPDRGARHDRGGAREAGLARRRRGRHRPRRGRHRPRAHAVSRWRSSSWGARKLFEKLGRERPAVILFEDVHWAESTFLELVEQVVAQASDCCLLVVCTARHELVERHPEWSTGPRRTAPRARAADRGRDPRRGRAPARDREARRRDPRADRRCRRGQPALRRAAALDADRRRAHRLRGRRVASHAVDSTSIAVPPDDPRPAGRPPRRPRLGRPRSPRAGGRHRAGLRARRGPAPDVRTHPAEVDVRLGSLTEKQLVERDRARSDEDAFRFQHILIRDTAYDGILKRARATLHERVRPLGGRRQPRGSRPSTRRSSATTWSRRTATGPSSARSTTAGGSSARTGRAG